MAFRKQEYEKEYEQEYEKEDGGSLQGVNLLLGAPSAIAPQSQWLLDGWPLYSTVPPLYEIAPGLPASNRQHQPAAASPSLSESEDN